MPVVLIDLSGPELTPDERALLANEPVAGLCLFSRSLAGRAQARDLIADARGAAGRPLLVTVDQEGGGVVRLLDGPVPPAAMALGAADDPVLTERVAAATARSLRAVGVDVDLAPVADVALDPDNPVIGDRAFGADPARVARHVAAFVRGLQGAGVAASLKHFPGHGDVNVDSHLALPTLGAGLERLREVEWRPFRAGITAGAASVMTAHLRVPSLDAERPATLSPRILGHLRGELGFDGVVFTDALNMRAVADRWPPPVAAVEALAAGADAPLSVGSVEEHREVLRAVETATRNGRLDPAALAAAEARLARLAAAFPPAPDPDARVDPADLEVMARAARRAVVALGATPRLRPGARVAVIGGGAVAASAASDAREDPTGALVAALRAAGHAVARVGADGVGLPDALRGAELAIVTTAHRTEPPEGEIAAARAGFAAARAAGVPAVHVPLWNPVHVRRLPGPALVPFGFRADAVAAVVDVLRTGEASGRPPLRLTVGPTSSS